jgi:hypothetical protein
MTVASLGAQFAEGVADRARVSAVPVHQQHGRPVEGRVTAKLDQQSRQGDMSDRQRAGEVRVLAARPDRDCRSEADAVPPGARALRNRDGDPGVGIERQVRSVLLKRTDRHDKHPPRARLNIRPACTGKDEPGGCLSGPARTCVHPPESIFLLGVRPWARAGYWRGRASWLMLDATWIAEEGRGLGGSARSFHG